MLNYAKLSVTVDVQIADPRAFARAAWKAAQRGGFTSKAEWSAYRRDGRRQRLAREGAVTALREFLFELDFRAAGLEPDIY